MLHTVMRQRRRFAFALILTQIALFGLWSQSVIIGIMLLGIVAGCLLVAASGHPVRRLIECGAIGVLLSSRMPTPILIGLTFVTGTALAYVLMYTSLLDRIPLRLGMRSRKTFKVNLDQRTTWAKLIPGQGHPAAYWTGTMMSAQPDQHDNDTLYVTLENGHNPVEEVTITYLKINPFITAKYLIERDTFLAGEEVMMTYRLEPISDEWTRIASDMQVSGLPVRHAVERFFDDVLGDELDSFATMTSCKRSWRLRNETDIDLTSELGTGFVQLRLSGKAQQSEAIADDSDAPKHRMSA